MCSCRRGRPQTRCHEVLIFSARRQAVVVLPECSLELVVVFLGKGREGSREARPPHQLWWGGKGRGGEGRAPQLGPTPFLAWSGKRAGSVQNSLDFPQGHLAWKGDPEAAPLLGFSAPRPRKPEPLAGGGGNPTPTRARPSSAPALASADLEVPGEGGRAAGCTARPGLASNSRPHDPAPRPRPFPPKPRPAPPQPRTCCASCCRPAPPPPGADWRRRAGPRGPPARTPLAAAAAPRDPRGGRADWPSPRPPAPPPRGGPGASRASREGGPGRRARGGRAGDAQEGGRARVPPLVCAEEGGGGHEAGAGQGQAARGRRGGQRAAAPQAAGRGRGCLQAPIR